MRRLILIAAVALCAACTPSATSDEVHSNTNVAVTANAEPSDCGIASNTLNDEKALFAAETAYNIPAHAYVSLGSKLPTETRTQVRGYLIQAYDALKLARTAYKAADGCSLKQYSDLAQAFGNKAKSLLPAK